jgi:hypothetical protein
MKKNLIPLLLLLLFLTSCETRLNKKDRALLDDMQAATAEARESAAMARDAAERAAIDANRASEKADRIFRHNNMK